MMYFILIGVICLLILLSFLRGKGHTSNSSSENQKENYVMKSNMEKKKKIKLTIWYGSQTGTAEDYSQRLKSEGDKLGFDPSVRDLEEFNQELIIEGLHIFVIATYGEGEPTDNAIEFFDWLKNDDHDYTLLSETKYCVFGLGNRQYEFFNKAAKIVDKHLSKLGAKRVYDYGDGDDDNNLEDDFDSWKHPMWNSLCDQFIEDTASSAIDRKKNRQSSFNNFNDINFKYKANFLPVEYDKESGAIIPFSSINHSTNSNTDSKNKNNKMDLKSIDRSSRDYFDCEEVSVVVNKELRRDITSGSTRHIEIDVKDNKRLLSYLTADNLGVLPENDPKIVEMVAQWLDYDLDSVLILESIDPNVKVKPLFPTPCTIRTALTRYIDLNGRVSKGLIGALSYFAQDQRHISRLQHLVSTDGKPEFQKWVYDAWRSLPEVLEEFPSIKIPIDNLLEIGSRLVVRYYTISSSNIVSPDRIHLTVSVVQQPKIDGRMHRGVCSAHISNCLVPVTDNGKVVYQKKKDKKNNSIATSKPIWPKLRVTLRPSTFKLPKDTTVPVILIGPGTGIAPMRAIIQERSFQRNVNQDKVGKTVLYFGCRHKDKDFIYEDELLGYIRDGTLDALYTAFSREGMEKVYVQHKLEETGEDVWKMMNNGAYIYVCGGTSMGGDVLSAVISIAEKFGGLSRKDAENLVKVEMKQARTYVQELWS